jgi:nucleoside-diphosphate-sugar epimerase
MNRRSAGLLVLGASGLLGRHLVHALLQQSADQPPLRLQLRPSSDAAPLLALLTGIEPTRYSLERYELDDIAALRQRFDGARTVFFLAAAKRGRAEDMARATLTATAAVLDALGACRAPPRLLHVSSLAIYATSQVAPGSAVDEASALEPTPWLRDAYTHLKCAQEALVRRRADRDGLALCVARPGILVGPGALAPPGRLALPLRGRWWLAPGLTLQLPLLHLRHAAAALSYIDQHARFEGEAFNLLDAPTLSGREFAALLREAGSAQRLIPIAPSLLARIGGLLQHAGHLRRGPLARVPTPYQVAAAWTPVDYRSALPALGFVAAEDVRSALRRDLELPS